MIVFLSLLNVVLLYVVFDCMYRLEKLSDDLRVALAKLDSVSEGINKKNEEMDLGSSIEPGLVLQVAVVLLGICIICYACYAVSDTSIYKLTKLLDHKASSFLDRYTNSQCTTKFAVVSSGFDALYTKHGNTCDILFKGPNDSSYKTLSVILEDAVARASISQVSEIVLTPEYQNAVTFFTT